MQRTAIPRMRRWPCGARALRLPIITLGQAASPCRLGRNQCGLAGFKITGGVEDAQNLDLSLWQAINDQDSALDRPCRIPAAMSFRSVPCSGKSLRPLQAFSIRPDSRRAHWSALSFDIIIDVEQIGASEPVKNDLTCTADGLQAFCMIRTQLLEHTVGEWEGLDRSELPAPSAEHGVERRFFPIEGAQTCSHNLADRCVSPRSDARLHLLLHLAQVTVTGLLRLIEAPPFHTSSYHAV